MLEKSFIKQVFIYGYPIVDMYRILHNFALDKKSGEFKAPLNVFGHSRQLANPNDTSIVAMNVDTLYSYAWLDLRCEPVVVHLPSFDEKRYVASEFFDLYTNILGYVSPRTNKNGGGDFLVTGPNWSGKAQKGIKGTFKSPTEFALILMRTQLFSYDDLENVIAIQDQCVITPLSKSSYAEDTIKSSKEPNSLKLIPTVDVRAKHTIEYFKVLSWMLQFMPTLQEDSDLRKQIEETGLLTDAILKENKVTITETMQEGMNEIYAKAKTIKSSAELFGSRQFYNGNYLVRATGAFLGILGNAAEEFLGVGYQADSDGNVFNGANNYTITFKPEDMPPVDAFWSITIYDQSKLLYANSINRYAINSTMVRSLTKNSDGVFTLYIQNSEPKRDELLSNWLPCPRTPFGITFRTYQPRMAIRTGAWTAPPVVKVPNTLETV